MLTNCIITQNTAGTGGGGVMCYLYECHAIITNCTISGNSSPNGAGLWCDYDSSPTVTNCILWGNGSEEIYSFFSFPVVTYCDVEGGYYGTGNINENPLFVEPGQDFHVSCDSPCRDVGIDITGLEIDYDHEVRPNPDTGIFDIGADEFYQSNSPTPTASPTQTQPCSPTPTPTYTASPEIPTSTPSPQPQTPTPNQCELGVHLEMPGRLFTPGMTVYLKAWACNDTVERMQEMKVFVFLDLNIGEYWFAPSWTHSLDNVDYYTVDLPPVEDTEIFPAPLTPFIWPDGVGTGGELCFWGGMTNPAMTEVIGVVEYWDFGYGT